MSDTYDVVVIGSGPGGYVAAIRAAQLGAKVACIDKGPLGGTCLNRGCIPTKALLEASHLAVIGKHAAGFGVNYDSPEIDFAKMMEHKSSVVDRLCRGVGKLFESNGIEHLVGTARLTGADSVEIQPAAGDPTVVEAKKIIIATGSEPTEIPAFPFDGEAVLSSTHALNLETRPESVLIVGGGYIGCEFACFFAEIGTTVYVVEMLDRLLPLVDGELSQLVTRSLKRLKVKVSTGTKVERLEAEDGKVTAELSGGDVVEADKALVAVGRKLNSDGIGLDAAGVEVGDENEILINDHCQTNVPNIYAIGDVTGKILLAHCATAMGTVAAEHATGHEATMDYRSVPATIFAHPEASYVGLSQEEAEQKGINARAFSFPLQVLGKGQVTGEAGMAKLVGDADTGELLGAQIVASRGGDMIAELALAIQLEATIEELGRTVHVHPTLSEGVKEAAEGWLGHGIHYNA
jgi:dihydrolipoamide dehydrogenase